MTVNVRKCPGCKEERSEEEALCGKCGWDLTQEPLRLPGQIDPAQEKAITTPLARFCPNGHLLDSGDEMCFQCGATAVEECAVENIPSKETVIDEWTVIEKLESHSQTFEKFIVERHGHRALLSLYFPNTHIGRSIYDVLTRLPKDYVLELLNHGEWQGRYYDVVDFISQTNLMDLLPGKIELETIRQIVKYVGRILHALAENGLRHRNLCPENILVVHRDPLSLLLTGFQYSHLSSYDLDTVSQPASAFYAAPEVIAGGISVASDWWSLGMVILQLITKGQCFNGINEKAFRIHVVTRGVSLPNGIDPSLNLLLRGLLARDPDQRWQWRQVQGWLAGDVIEAPSDSQSEVKRGGPAIDLNGHSYDCPKAYALAAAEATNWNQAKDLFMRGVIATWLEEYGVDSMAIAGVRLASSIDSIPDDFRHALALMWMNPSLPLIYQGEIVTSSWLLQNQNLGYEVVAGPIKGHLRQMNREPHLCELHDRLQRARERARVLEIELNEESFRVLALASSRQNLERQWTIHRRLYPASDNGGLNSLMDRQKITDEELIILLGAGIHQYQPAEQILDEADFLASQVELASYDRNFAKTWFDISRRDLYRQIEERIANYSRCGILRVDEWADDFRNERRILLPRAIALLSVPKESWKELPRQQYVSTILEFFEKRTARLAQRGPLVRMLITKACSRVDLVSIDGKKQKAASILEHLISRVEVPVAIDRTAFEANTDLEKKLRRLISHANTCRRDTGIDSLYLGFPFLVMKEKELEVSETKPRIAPILLWPIRIDMENRDQASILFDRDRDDVRFNPALTRLLGVEEAKRWVEVAKELLGRSTIRTADVMDAFGALVESRERALCALPDKDYKVAAGSQQVVCSAVLFHAEFMGQAIGEDLRQMRKESTVGTSLEIVLRINKDPIACLPLPLIPEKDRYFTMESDPSQEKSVFRARQAPGLLIEGPPGTGKSQTIVNIIGDCIGRKQTVLVVCQKSAALEVLAKRLVAEGLRDRFCYITHVNKDRTSVVQSIRNQIEGIFQSMSEYRSKNVVRERDELAEEIQRSENDIDKHHVAIHAIDEATGLSYRVLLGQLIDLEDHETGFFDVPALRRLFIDLGQKQLSELVETCSPISGIWLESLFEGSPLSRLKFFSSDAALVNEFRTTLLSFLDKEKKRDELYRQLTGGAFDVDNLSPHQEWVNSHEHLLKNVNWKDIASWFHLFSLGNQSEGAEIIKRLEEIKQRLSSLKVYDQNEIFSSKLIEIPLPALEEWLSLAQKATTFHPLSFINQKVLQRQLEELNLHLNSFKSCSQDRTFSDKLVATPLSTLEDWFSLVQKASPLHPLSFVHHDSLQGQLEELKNQLKALEVHSQDETLSSKLVDITFETLEKWLSLAQNATVLHPISFIQLDSFEKQLEELKKQLNSLKYYPQDRTFSGKLVDTSLSTLERWLSLAQKARAFHSLSFVHNDFLQKQLEELKQQLNSLEVHPHDETFSSKLIDTPLTTLEKWFSLAREVTTSGSFWILFNPLRFVRLRRIKKILAGLNESQTLEKIILLQNEVELEVKKRSIREAVLILFKKIYAETEIFKPLLQKDLCGYIDCALKDLWCVDQLKAIVSDLGSDPTFDKTIQLKSEIELEKLLRPIRAAVLKLLEQLYQETVQLKPLQLEDLCMVVERMRKDLARVAQLKTIGSDLGIDPTFDKITQLKIDIELEKQLRLIRVSVFKFLEQLYQETIQLKPIQLEDLRMVVERMLKDLAYVAQLKALVSELGYDSTFDKTTQLKSDIELEKQLRPIRTCVLKLLEQIYQETTQLKPLHLEDLCIVVERMLKDLAYVAQLKILLSYLGSDPTFDEANKFTNIFNLEIQQRPLRFEILKFREALYPGVPISRPISLKELLSVVDVLMGNLLLAKRGIMALRACPRQEEIESIVKMGLAAYQDLLARYGEAFKRYQARVDSLDTLERLSSFFSEELVNICRVHIHESRSNLAELQPIVELLPSLSSYQEFRLQAPHLPPRALKIFAILREKEAKLRACPIEGLEEIVRRLITREALLAWKDRIEQKFPILRLAQKELFRGIKALDQRYEYMRKLNQKFLAFNIDIEKIRAAEEWEDITRLKGPRACRLREIIERGWDMGLRQSRPVWLMSPDTASQLLPLKAGMFDVVIFDEASQIPIENALPTLYRAKRVVISGDEKQMPPTNVFIRRLEDDEEYDHNEEDLDETATETERAEREDTWNRREIKDCSDLLALGKTVLPRSMLQIHYRSKYRELIAFSNAAFYGNHLSVPARHPESVIQNIRPIEVVRVDGIYSEQTNGKEAEKVVDLLVELWKSPVRPSIGVVTFNAKQADLIEDVLAERAENDSAFRQALSQERERQQGGEDMGFFVKNVENVQGDERDLIIFSSTFGRDKEGTFRRQFGLLSQEGGERRLNVAITRAREKVIIVTSLPIKEISDALTKRQNPQKARDYLQAYFDYASKISEGSLETARKTLDRMSADPLPSQSGADGKKDGFVRSVGAFIKSLGLEAFAIKENDAFGLDFVIEDSKKKRFGVGIECDAHCHPILETARAREVWRPKVLRMEIPHVHRVTSYGWYHRRKEEKKHLKQVLEDALGIPLAEGSLKTGSGR